MEPAGLPGTVLVIWGVALLVIALVIVPVAILLLRRALHAARSIETYLDEMRAAGAGIAANTAAIPALDKTIEIAGAMGKVAASLDRHAGAIAGILAARARSGSSR